MYLHSLVICLYNSLQCLWRPFPCWMHALMRQRAFLHLHACLHLCYCILVKHYLLMPKYCNDTQVDILPRTLRIPTSVADLPILIRMYQLVNCIYLTLNMSAFISAFKRWEVSRPPRGFFFCFLQFSCAISLLNTLLRISEVRNQL